MNQPTNVHEVRTLMGVVQFLLLYIPNLSLTAAAIRQLLKGENCFVWTSEQQRSFEAIKAALSDPRLLRIFNELSPVVIATDASGTGLGGVLMQPDPNTGELHPVQYVSRSVTSPETRNSPIELELMAVVFALERLRYYTLGREVQIQTDHKPLLGLVKRDLDDLTPRLRCFVERLFPYQLTWEHIDGKENLLPDYLSRLPLGSPTP